jgi:hypothetical protein
MAVTIKIKKVYGWFMPKNKKSKRTNWLFGFLAYMMQMNDNI